ncbi:MAG: anaerobic ribonucleoside-triphosphate reductase activating protein, partial [Candidatus Adiutrix sp.]
MRIGGLIRATTIDYPGGLISAVIFTQGCNFTCPYCHNPQLVRLFGEPVDEGGVFDFLQKRRNLLDGVVISGGEPTIQPDLGDFCQKLKNMGFMVKLDTNGSRPKVVADLLSRQVIDYVALDLKGDPANYPLEIASPENSADVIDTIKILKSSKIPHEYRCTVATPLISHETIITMAKAASGAET